MQLYVPNQASMMEWEGQKLMLRPGVFPCVPEGHPILKAHPRLFEQLAPSPGFELHKPEAKPQGKPKAKVGA